MEPIKTNDGLLNWITNQPTCSGPAGSDILSILSEWQPKCQKCGANKPELDTTREEDGELVTYTFTHKDCGGHVSSIITSKEGEKLLQSIGKTES